MGRVTQDWVLHVSVSVQRKIVSNLWRATCPLQYVLVTRTPEHAVDTLEWTILLLDSCHGAATTLLSGFCSPTAAGRDLAHCLHFWR